MSECIYIIGIDCATEAKKVGLSFGTYNNGTMEVLETKVGVTGTSIAKEIWSWIKDKEKVLLAIDAPLGWPSDLGSSLASHYAGDSLDINSNLLFRRETDKFIKKSVGKQSLDVGADRIARTAHAALKILSELRNLSGQEISLTWNSKITNSISAIEVYPAATLDSYKIISIGYKDKEKTSVRNEIISEIKNLIKITTDNNILISNADALDSAICLLAAKDFLEEKSYYPEHEDLAKKEGWIWVKDTKK